MFSLFRTVIAVAFIACGGGGKPVASSSGNGNPVVVTDTVIELLDPVQFTDEGEVVGNGYQTLDAIVATLQGKPEIQLVEIQGRVGDDDGQGEAGREARAQKRAELVMAYLVKAGVEVERLTAKGYTDFAKAESSHVSFLIVKRAEPAPAAPPVTTTPVTTPVATTPVTTPVATTPVTTPQPAGTPPATPDAEMRASKKFLALVDTARPGIRDCHRKAIKADAKLASVRVMLQIITSFTRKGSYVNSSTSPPLGDAFEACMKTVMAAWTLGPQTEDYSFQTTVILDP